MRFCAIFAAWLLGGAAVGLSASPGDARFENESVVVTFTVSNRWDTGFQGDIVVENKTDVTLADWVLGFRFAHEVEEIWNARIVSKSGDRYTIDAKPFPWNSAIAPKGKVAFGFVASPGGLTQPPDEFSFSPTPGGATPTPTPTGTPIPTPTPTGTPIPTPTPTGTPIPTPTPTGTPIPTPTPTGFQEIYALDFSSPEHAVNKPVSVGTPPGEVSRITLGTPTVRRKSGVLAERPLEFDAEAGGEQIRLDLPVRPVPGYRIEFDVAAQQLVGSAFAFTCVLDTPEERSVSWHGGTGKVRVFQSTPFTSADVATFENGKKYHITILVDFEAGGTWKVYRDYEMIYEAALAAPTVSAVRFGLAPWKAGPGSAARTKVALDNVQIFSGVVTNYVPRAPFAGGPGDVQFEDGSVIVTFRVTNDWSSGFQGDFVIENKTAEVLRDWSLAFRFNRKLTGPWNAQIASKSGDRYTFDGQNYAWNKDIPAGGNVSFGCVGTPGKVKQPPTDFVFQSGSIHPTPTPTPTPDGPKVLYDVNFSSPHRVNRPPAQGAAPARVSSIPAGSPTVRRQAGALDAQPLVFDAEPGGEQIRLDLPTAEAAGYRIDFDVATENLQGAAYALTMFLDTPEQGSIALHGGVGGVRVYHAGSSADVGAFHDGQAYHFAVVLDFSGEASWAIYRDGGLLYEGTWSGNTLSNIRFGLVPSTSGATRQARTKAAIDNIRILSGEPSQLVP